jgi:ribosomal-protein-alanine N-acetyltransferase
LSLHEPRLETRRLYLRLMRPSDLEDLLKIFGDTKVMDSFGVAPFDREQTRRWMQRNLDHQEQHTYGLFSVILKSEEVMIGDCGLEHMEVDGQQVAELGYDLRSAYWNQGYATEAAGAVRDYALEVLRLPRVISLIQVGNEASRRVSEKIGMHLEGEIELGGLAYWKYAF